MSLLSNDLRGQWIHGLGVKLELRFPEINVFWLKHECKETKNDQKRHT